MTDTLPDLSIFQPFNVWLMNVISTWRELQFPKWSFDDGEREILLSLEPPEDCSGVVPPYPVFEIGGWLTVWIGDHLFRFGHHAWKQEVLRHALLCHRTLNIEYRNLQMPAERVFSVSNYSPDWFLFSQLNIEEELIFKDFEFCCGGKSTFFRGILNAVLFYASRPEKLIEKRIGGQRVLTHDWTPNDRVIVGPFDEKRIYINDSTHKSSTRKLHKAHWRGRHVCVLRHEKFGRLPNGGFRTIVKERCLVGKNLIAQVTA